MKGFDVGGGKGELGEGGVPNEAEILEALGGDEVGFLAAIFRSADKNKRI